MRFIDISRLRIRRVFDNDFHFYGMKTDKILKHRIISLLFHTIYQRMEDGVPLQESEYLSSSWKTEKRSLARVF